MKYLSLTALFITLIFQSCQNQNQTNKTTTPDDTAAIETSSDTNAVNSPSIKTSPSNEASIFMIDTYRMDEYSEDPEKILNEGWLDLYEEKGEYYLAKVDYKIEDGFSECAGVPTKGIISKRNSILFLNFPFLKAGKIENLKITKAEIWPKETVLYDFNNQKYLLKGYGDIVGTNIQTNDQNHEEVFHDVKNYKLTCSVNGNSEMNMFKAEQFNDTFIKTLFVGDIDRDGKLDFIISTPTDYEENSIMLILSSQVKDNDLDKSSYKQDVQFDC